MIAPPGAPITRWAGGVLPDPPRETLALPTPPVAPARAGFPLVATLAPVAVSLMLWAATRSVFSLLFAMLGPVVAVGGLVDGRFSRRRTRRRDELRFRLAVGDTLAEVHAAHERARLRCAQLVVPPGAARWRHDPAGPLPVLLGHGSVASALDLPGAEPRVDSSRFHDDLDGIRVAAARVENAPVLADARDGIGIVGPPVLADGIARSLALQLAGQLSPAGWQVHIGESWALELPHDAHRTDGGRLLWRSAGAQDVVVAWGATASELPLGCATIVDTSSGESRVAGRSEASGLRPTALSAAEAATAARALAERAAAHDLRAPGASLPSRVELAGLLSGAAGPGLSAPIGRGADGVVTVDLVADGPHAVVAGTTGSGKSELLVAWVLGMAAGRSPEQVTFLLVDFKGGAAFAPLAGLPHVLGTLSDLDPRSTRRAIESLRAELRHRERVLAAAGLRSIEELAPSTLPRLVVVVDEFAAMVSASPELHEVFGDLAARGRSLGLHLVLCTQRPAGVIRDAVLANVGLRLSLRVADRADSIAILGDDGAARLPVEPRGRGMLSLDGTVTQVQLAIADVTDAERIASRPEGSAPRRRPWHDPLPRRLALSDLPVGRDERRLVFGLADLPDEQRQPPAAYDPVHHGHLLVLGATGSGVTTALDTFAASAVAAGRAIVRVPAEPADAWAVLADARERPEPGRVLLIDDLDSLLGRFDDDYRHPAVELVTALLRGSPVDVEALVVGARRLTGALAGLAGSFGARLLLRQASREDHVLAGGDPARFDPDAPPGSGTWRGVDVQVAVAESAPRPTPPTPSLPMVRPADHAVLAVVAGRPARLAEALRENGYRIVDLSRGSAPPADDLMVARGPVPTVLIGDPDAWQAEWALLTAARRNWPIVLVGCAPADHRILMRDRELPPPLAHRSAECWLASGGTTVRAVLDTVTTRGSEEKQPENR